MNPTLGLLLQLTLAQPPAVSLPQPGPGCATCPAPGGVTVPQYLLAPPPKPRDLCPPVGPPAPLLAVKPILADGYTLAVDPTEKGFASASVWGFRPGYVYRLKFVNADHPEDTVGGTLEVRGSIVPRPNMKYMEFPATVGVSKTDVKTALGGGIVTKVIYLEDPAKALPLGQKANDPLEVAAADEREALDLAADSGRVVAVLRVGGRVPSAKELAGAYIDGTVLLPGESALLRPAVPPPFGCSPVPLYDPILGPKVSTDECFPNGGDRGPRVGIGPGGRLGNLDPTDAAMEYTRGTKREAVVSNTVCLCSPRFVARRAEAVASVVSGAIAPLEVRQAYGQSVFLQRMHAEELVGRERTLGLTSRTRPGATLQYVYLHALGSTTSLKGIATTLSTDSVTAVVVVDELTSFPTRLTLEKSVSPAGPYQPGDEVTITLKYANNTRQEIKDLVISDSLSGRLEYVAGSAAADRPSNVTTALNDAGSVVVRFDIPGPIPPTASGVAVFKVKVR